MAEIQNKLDRKLMIILDSGENLDLLAKSKVKISDKDFSSSHLQRFIERGDIEVITGAEAKKRKTEHRRSAGKHIRKKPK